MARYLWPGILAVWLFALANQAAEAPKPGGIPAPAPGTRPLVAQVQGAVKSVDVHNRSFTLHEAGGKPWKLTWTPQTRFFVAGHAVKANTLAPGIMVKVEYSVASGRAIAAQVILYPLKSPPRK